VLGGAAAMLLSVQVSMAIAGLLAVVALSYRQVCRAYPNGGGAYVVARTNLAPVFGLIAAASLLIDYVMTVAVSTASAIVQIQSVIPAAFDWRIHIAFVSIALITVANLRGLRESGNIFAVPTYLFVGLALAIVRPDLRLLLVEPMLRRTTMLVVVLQIIASLKVFDQMYIMTAGGPNFSTRSVLEYIYDEGFTNFRVGYASALSMLFFLVVLAVSAVWFMIVRSQESVV
jgi:hypothetical protein